MSYEMWAIVLFAAGVALLTLELFLPAHGVLGVLGVIGVVGAIGSCFAINQWVGLAALVLGVLASPVVAGLAMHLWPKTPIGRRIMLHAVDSPVHRPPVAVGQSGVTTSELRPMGTVDFAGERIEARSELGIIPPGTRVRVVSFDNNRPCVRAEQA
jgi:membrane-bound ClpP family serine protease